MKWQFKNPSWWGSKGIVALLLWPFSLLYQCVYTLRRWINFPSQSDIPIICVGNIVAGGAGKTPLVIYLARHFQAVGLNVVCLSKGYGGQITMPVRVDLSIHDAYLVGDEALLLAKIAPTYIGIDRKAVIIEASKEKPDLLIMDDGFQNPTFYKDFHFLVLSGYSAIGNGFQLPAGPLRETLSSALKRADAVMVIGDDESKIMSRLQKTDKPIFQGKYVPLNSVELVRPWVAFSGIGQPEKFFQFLKGHGAHVKMEYAFPDHYVFHHQDLQKLLLTAKQCNAKLITTEKDWVRLPNHWKRDIQYCPIELKVEDSVLMEGLLHRMRTPKMN